MNPEVAVGIRESLGCRVEVAGNGRRPSRRSGGYDLILKDCPMPEMDGFEAARAIGFRKNSPP